MIRNQIYTAYNSFLHIDEAIGSSVMYRKAKVYLNDVPLLQSSLIAFKVNNQFEFRLNKLLEDAQPEIYAPNTYLNLEDVLLEAQPSHTKTLKIIVSNMDDSNPTETLYPVLLCKMPVEKFASLQQDTLQVNFQSILSNRNEIQYVSPDQPVYFHTLAGFEMVSDTIDFIKVFAKFVFDDETDTTIEISSLADVQNNILVGFYGSLALLSALIPKNLQSKTLQYCYLYFTATIDTETQQISPELFVVPDKAYYQDEKTIVYQNQFGVYESLRFLGTVAKENEVSSEDILNNGIEKNIAARFRKKLSLQLSTEQDDIEAITDDLSLSKRIYLIENGEPIALVKDFKALKSFDSSTVNDTPTFDFKYPYEY